MNRSQNVAKNVGVHALSVSCPVNKLQAGAFRAMHDGAPTAPPPHRPTAPPSRRGPLPNSGVSCNVVAYSQDALTKGTNMPGVSTLRRFARSERDWDATVQAILSPASAVCRTL